jgi:AraC-like DNA-binding protein
MHNENLGFQSIETPTLSDVNRIYQGFNDAYQRDPARFDFLSVKPFCDNDSGVRVELDSDEAMGYWVLFRANPDLLICITDGLYHSQYLQTVLPHRDLITLRFVLSSGLSVTFGDTGKITIPQASASVMYTRKDNEFDVSIDKGSHLCSVTVHIKPQFLYSRFDIDKSRLPERLADVICDQKQHNNLCSFPLSPGMMHIILDLINMPYHGVRRRLVTEAKVAELLCRFFQEAEQDRASVEQSPSPGYALKGKLFEAQKILIEHYVDPPSVTDLARRVGLNRSTLCEEFKKLFGSSVFEFVQGYRMNKARELLNDGHLAVSQVADALGYQHPTNFTSAFKKHFGFLPKALRS